MHSSTRQTLHTVNNASQGLKSVNSATTVVYKTGSPRPPNIIQQQTHHRQETKPSISTINYNTQHNTQQHQHNNISQMHSPRNLLNSPKPNITVSPPEPTHQSHNITHQSNIHTFSNNNTNKPSQILCQITNLDNLNKQLLKILDRINQTTYLQQQNNRVYNQSSQSLYHNRIKTFENDINKKFMQLVSNIKQFYKDIDNKIKLLGNVISQDYIGEISRMKTSNVSNTSNNINKNLSYLSIGSNNNNNVGKISMNNIHQPFINNSNQLHQSHHNNTTNQQASIRYDNLSDRIKDLQQNLHASKQNQGKLINIIEVLLKDKDSTGGQSRNTIQNNNRYSTPNTYNNNIRAHLPHAQSQLVMLPSYNYHANNIHKNGLTAESRISLYEKLSQYDQSIAESIEHLRIYDDNASQVSNNANTGESKVYIKNLYAKRDSNAQTINNNNNKKSLRPENTRNTVQDSKDKKHRMDFLLGSLKC